MNNYLPLTIPGTKRRRAKFAELHNTYGTNPKLRWLEEDQILMADGTYAYVNAGFFDVEITLESLAEEFPVLDIDSGKVLYTMPRGQLLNAISSVYIKDAMNRDEKEIL